MDIFLSYRRGDSDTPQAGRIHDYLCGLGLEVYYDQSEQVNPTGTQFPRTIESALANSKVLVAVIGPNWLSTIDRLRDTKDWVRRELFAGHPKHGKRLVPIYLGVEPTHLVGRLPDELSFLHDTNSQLLWRRFEEPEKETLAALLRPWLPSASRARTGDVPRLELLCDRVRAEARFGLVVERQAVGRSPIGWLLFGEVDQGHAQLFERITAFTLKQSLYSMRYPKTTTIKLDLDEYRNSSLDEMNAYVFSAVANALGAARLHGYGELYAALAAKHISLAFCHAVVVVSNARQSAWWSTRFDALLRQLVPRAADPHEPKATKAEPPCVVFALAIVYERSRGVLAWLTSCVAIARVLEKQPRLRSVVLHRHGVEKFLAAHFPEHFTGDDEPLTAPSRADSGPFVTSRLQSAQRSHVEDWCDSPRVRPHMEGLREDALRPFDRATHRPMGVVIESLGTLLRRRALSLTPGASA